MSFVHTTDYNTEPTKKMVETIKEILNSALKRLKIFALLSIKYKRTEILYDKN